MKFKKVTEKKGMLKMEDTIDLEYVTVDTLMRIMRRQHLSSIGPHHQLSFFYSPSTKKLTWEVNIIGNVSTNIYFSPDRYKSVGGSTETSKYKCLAKNIVGEVNSQQMYDDREREIPSYISDEDYYCGNY